MQSGEGGDNQLRKWAQRETKQTSVSVHHNTERGSGYSRITEINDASDGEDGEETLICYAIGLLKS